jgi:hypothetical protein
MYPKEVVRDLLSLATQMFIRIGYRAGELFIDKEINSRPHKLSRQGPKQSQYNSTLVSKEKRL